MRTILFSEKTGLSAEAEFPTTGKEVQEVCDKLGIKNVAQAEVKVEAVNFLGLIFALRSENWLFVSKKLVFPKIPPTAF